MLLDYSTFTSFSGPTVISPTLVQVLLPCFQYTSSLLLLSLILAVKKNIENMSLQFYLRC